MKIEIPTIICAIILLSVVLFGCGKESSSDIEKISDPFPELRNIYFACESMDCVTENFDHLFARIEALDQNSRDLIESDIRLIDLHAYSVYKFLNMESAAEKFKSKILERHMELVGSEIDRDAFEFELSRSVSQLRTVYPPPNFEK